MIGQNLDSIIGQSYNNWECLVIDDGSKDYTEELMEFYKQKDSRIQYIHRPNHLTKGANSCRNYGFTKSRGDFVNWFDSDDVMLSQFVEDKMNSFANDSDMVISSGYYVDDKLQPIKKLPVGLKYTFFKDLILGNQIIITNSVMFRRCFLEKQSLFNPIVNRGEETEFFSRIFFQAENQTIQIINKPLFLYRQHSGTKTSHNRFYVNSFKESLSYIAIENLCRSIKLNDRQLIQYYYNQLMALFFQGLENDHVKNSRYIFNKVRPHLRELNRRLFFEFTLVGSLLIQLKRSSYRLSKRYREAKVFTEQIS
ncbi:hypothetical protein GCM10010465_26740 [Actinomadura fibrosa]